MRFLMSEGDQQSATEEGQSLLHRLGHFGATIGKKAPKKRSTRLIIQGGFAFLIFAFLVRKHLIAGVTLGAVRR